MTGNIVQNVVDRFSRFVQNSENNQFSRFKLMNYLNMMLYALRRNRWCFDPRFYFSSYDHIHVDRPIFLLGTPGGGLTLVSRMLRRCQQVVSISGHYRYWSGADEMQLVFGSVLPSALNLNYNTPEKERFGQTRHWLFAIDELVDHYRHTGEDASESLRNPLLHVIRWSIHTHAPAPNSARFLDKSQLYTVNVDLLDTLLSEEQPQFLLVTRNPYAMCYRATDYGSGGLKNLEGTYSFKERLALAAEHWSNSMKLALEDGQRVNEFHYIRFEDVLHRPEARLQEMCGFLDFPYRSKFLPNPRHRIPFGSKYRKKWYPLRKDVNQKHMKQMTDEEVQIVERRCGDLADRFGYDPPSS